MSGRLMSLIMVNVIEQSQPGTAGRDWKEQAGFGLERAQAGTGSASGRRGERQRRLPGC